MIVKFLNENSELFQPFQGNINHLKTILDNIKSKLTKDNLFPNLFKDYNNHNNELKADITKLREIEKKYGFDDSFLSMIKRKILNYETRLKDIQIYKPPLPVENKKVFQIIMDELSNNKYLAAIGGIGLGILGVYLTNRYNEKYKN